MENKFAIVMWDEENKSSVINMRSIKEPRKPIKEYYIGEAVRANFQGKVYPAHIVDIAGKFLKNFWNN